MISETLEDFTVLTGKPIGLGELSKKIWEHNSLEVLKGFKLIEKWDRSMDNLGHSHEEIVPANVYSRMNDKMIWIIVEHSQDVGALLYPDFKSINFAGVLGNFRSEVIVFLTEDVTTKLLVDLDLENRLANFEYSQRA